MGLRASLRIFATLEDRSAKWGEKDHSHEVDYLIATFWFPGAFQESRHSSSIYTTGDVFSQNLTLYDEFVNLQ